MIFLADTLTDVLVVFISVLVVTRVIKYLLIKKWGASIRTPRYTFLIAVIFYFLIGLFLLPHTVTRTSGYFFMALFFYMYDFYKVTRKNSLRKLPVEM